jgi:hypothetical protein
VITAGTAAALVGIIGLTLVVSEAGLSASAIELSPVLVLIGIGSGLVVPLIVSGVLQSVPGSSAGAASGVLTTTQQFSITLGISAVGTLFFSRLASAGMVAAMQAGLIADLALVGLALTMTILLARPPSADGATDEAEPVALRSAEEAA